MKTLAPTIGRQRLALLLWLALLLPIAQWASARHALLHVANGTATQYDGAPLPHTEHCDLCLAATALDSGVADTTLRLPHGVSAVQALPTLAPLTPVAAVLVLAYRSRAPPLGLC